MKRTYVDLSHVPEHQADMHERLRNWARACRSVGMTTSPMFRLYRSTEHWQGAPAATAEVVDQSDAVRVARGVQALPEPHLHSLNWFYLSDGNPMAGRRKLACTAEMLCRYVVDGRQMLINRNV